MEVMQLGDRVLQMLKYLEAGDHIEMSVGETCSIKLAVPHGDAPLTTGRHNTFVVLGPEDLPTSSLRRIQEVPHATP